VRNILLTPTMVAFILSNIQYCIWRKAVASCPAPTMTILWSPLS